MGEDVIGTQKTKEEGIDNIDFEMMMHGYHGHVGHAHVDGDHVHSKDQHHNEPKLMRETDDGRKLSRKFSGIADILQKKIKAEKSQTQEEEEVMRKVIRKNNDERAWIFGLI